MNNTEELIQEAVNKLETDFISYPDKYLTEEDVRVHLCYYLLENFGEIKETADGGQSIALHSEMRWWGDEKSRERSDIVIMNVSNLCVTEKWVREEIEMGVVPRKGYSITWPIAVIELKLRRRNTRKLDSRFKNEVEDDINKLEKIKNRIPSSIDFTPFYLVVALDKERLVETIKGKEGIKLKYISSKM